MGRPTKLTAETSQTILDVIAAGGTVAVAAQVAGVHRGTIYRWLRRGEQEATATEAALDPDAYTATDLRAIARTAGMMATSRMNKNGGPGPSGQRPATGPRAFRPHP